MDSNQLLEAYVEQILANNNILDKVSRAVLNRLPKSAFSDINWCRGVINDTIEEIFFKSNISDIAVGFLKDILDGRSEIETKYDKILPPFSISEPKSDSNRSNKFRKGKSKNAQPDKVILNTLTF